MEFAIISPLICQPIIILSPAMNYIWLEYKLYKIITCWSYHVTRRQGNRFPIASDVSDKRVNDLFVCFIFHLIFLFLCFLTLLQYLAWFKCCLEYNIDQPFKVSFDLQGLLFRLPGCIWWDSLNIQLHKINMDSNKALRREVQYQADKVLNQNITKNFYQLYQFKYFYQNF